MYLGRLRYWLYSTPISRHETETIQKDADRLWWSKDPWDTTKRYKRWVEKKTSRGPYLQGGLKEMDWAAHVQAYWAQWVFRYIRPEKSKWKEMWDAILFTDKTGYTLPEGRGTLFLPLTPHQKGVILGRLPRRAIYAKMCLKSFWKLKLTQDLTSLEAIGAESIWHNPRYKFTKETKPTKAKERYYVETLNIRQLRDIIDSETNLPFTNTRWEEWIDDLHARKHRSYPPSATCSSSYGIRPSSPCKRDPSTHHHTPHHNYTPRI
jgi:hypothetical protein